jgi:Tol biopolymer transport system component
MGLSPGQTLSFYEILGPLGAGGMGEVYRARDTRLEREVALKVLPDELADDEERLRRFEREAKTLASLHHPHVASIFGIDQVGETCLIAMELVPGEDLAARLARGPLPLEEALDVCRQIAEGLEAAHEIGVVHRDLKPANVRVTPDGVVKILDFGLAKLIHVRSSASGTTRTAQSDSFLVTEEGLMLGTPTYMSPEQARAKPVDRRTDVWAFGCVLFECLTGRRAFGGESLTDVLAAIVEHEPDWSALPAATPPRVRELLRRCLDKRARTRLRDVGEARIVLETPFAGRLERVPAGAGRSWLPGLLAGLVLAAAAVVVVLVTRRNEPPAFPVVRSTVYVPQELSFTGDERPLSLSPDGRALLVVAAATGPTQRRWMRPLDGRRFQALAGTEGAVYPFWSPDGSEIAFVAEGKLKRMPANGGNVTTICESASSRGGAWGNDGTIVFAPRPFGPLYRVPATGGVPREITWVSGRESHRCPHFLPDGRRLLYARSNSDQNGVWLLDLLSGESELVMEGASEGVYVEPGTLFFVRGGDLMAQPFDVDGGALAGEPQLVVEDVRFWPFRYTGAYAFSNEGTLVTLNDTGTRQLEWFDADGRSQGRLGSPARYDSISLSPDGQRIAATIGDGERIDLWLMDAERGLGVLLHRDVEREMRTVWSPDGGWLAVSSQVGDDFDTLVIAADGREPDREINRGWPSDWSKDGAWMLLYRQLPRTSFDVYYVRADGSGEPTVFAQAAASEIHARFSPDGAWVAFLTDGGQIQAGPFPGPGPVRPVVSDVSMEGPAWLDDGRIVYRSAVDQTLLAVPMSTGDGRLTTGKPVPFFGGRVPRGPFAISEDGRRVLVAVLADDAVERCITLVQNWPKTLGR